MTYKTSILFEQYDQAALDYDQERLRQVDEAMKFAEVSTAPDYVDEEMAVHDFQLSDHEDRIDAIEADYVKNGGNTLTSGTLDIGTNSAHDVRIERNSNPGLVLKSDGLWVMDPTKASYGSGAFSSINLGESGKGLYASYGNNVTLTSTANLVFNAQGAERARITSGGLTSGHDVTTSAAVKFIPVGGQQWRLLPDTTSFRLLNDSLGTGPFSISGTTGLTTVSSLNVSAGPITAAGGNVMTTEIRFLGLGNAASPSVFTVANAGFLVPHQVLANFGAGYSQIGEMSTLITGWYLDKSTNQLTVTHSGSLATTNIYLVCSKIPGGSSNVW